MGPSGSAGDARGDEANEHLFDFSDAAAVAGWSAIDDRVMGGVSRSRLRATGEGTAAFEGDLSLESGGGFASVRSAPARHDLSARAGMALRARGDGRTYKLRLRTDAAFDGVSYQASFPTAAGVWATIRLPFSEFRASLRGHAVPGAPPLDTGAIATLGLLVADRQAGAFRLELEWIGAYGAGSAD